MSDDQHLDQSDEAVVSEETTGEAVNWSSWSNLWQIPSMVLSVALIAWALSVALDRAPENDFEGALNQIDEFLAEGYLDLAEEQLDTAIRPHLAAATPLQEARFHRAVADWIYLKQRSLGTDEPENNTRIDKHYARATEGAAPMNAKRLERWGHVLISLGAVERARDRLVELEGLAGAGGESGAEAKRARNRVLRRLVEHNLRQPDLSYDAMMQVLSDYRSDSLLSVADEAWAAARQAELRLASGAAQDAVTHLLLDMRRLEARVTFNDDVNFAELYTLLARGYYDLGQYPQAEFQIQQALDRFTGPDPRAGDALVLLGEIAIVNGQIEDAYAHFDRVIRDYANTRSYLAGLLGRAEVSGIMQNHDASLADYTSLREALSKAGPRRDVTPMRVAQSLNDRHDAALTRGELDRALAYLQLAEGFFSPNEVPAFVLFGIAYTSRQLADNIVAGMVGDQDQRLTRPEAIDPELSYQANTHYKRAADYYVRHARAIRPTGDDAERWPESLWMAADSYDLAGWHDQAIAHFREYVAGRGEGDARRTEAMFRLSQALEASMDYAAAAEQYAQVIDSNPKSPWSARSHVPLARCLVKLDRREDAIRRLNRVVTADPALRPDSADYREALLELGKVYHEGNQLVEAIEILDKVLKLYPDDPRTNETRFRLADSYRAKASEIAETLRQPTVPSMERRRLEDIRTAHLTTARDHFRSVREAYLQADAAELNLLQSDLLRFAYLYQADCEFHLENYVDAIRLYNEVARRYPAHHSSMTALIQVVNCHYRLGDLDKAQAAHQRALARLKKLPDDAFASPDAMMDRAAWEYWLANSPLGGTRTASAQTN